MRLTIPIQLRWGDLDPYGHVNNVRMLSILEEARVQAFWIGGHEASAPTTAILDAGPTSTTQTVIAHQAVDYLKPIFYYREPLLVELWIGRIGGASIDVCYEVFPPASEEVREVFTRALSVVVLLDPATGSSRRINDEERAAWTPYLEEPVRLRGRS